MKKLVSLFLLFLSVSYGTQKGVAAASWGALASKYLLPRPLKGVQALHLAAIAGTANDHRWLNFGALISQEDLPIAAVFNDVDKYFKLRSKELHHRNIAVYFHDASRTELNTIIAFLSVDVREVLPQSSHLTHDEFMQMAKETGELRLRDTRDVSVEETSKTDLDYEFGTELTHYWRIITDVVRMSADGYAAVINGFQADVINGFQALYAAEEFDKMNNILLDTWKRHYDALYKSELADLLDSLVKEKKVIRTKLEELGILSYTLDKSLGEFVRLDLEEVEEVAHKLNMLADKDAVVEYLARTKVPDVFFYPYNNGSTRGVIPHQENISAKYHAVLDELDLAEDILAGVYELDKRDMRYLAYQLKKATR